MNDRKNEVIKYEGHHSSELYRSVVNAIMRANWKEMQEGRKMREVLRELFAEDWEEAEAKGRKLGREEGREEGMRVMAETLSELGLDYMSIKKQFIEKFSLTEDMCRIYLEKFLKTAD